jgi:hypothetical protein
MNRLDELALKYGTDKGPGAHNYTAAYHGRLSHLVPRRFKMLEIGVFGGASLRMWEEFFPLAQVHGIDIDPACLAHAGGRIAVDLVDQGCKEALAEYGRRAGGFELIVDDGGHAMAPQILSFEMLFPMMPPGGIYIIEDTGSSYSRWGWKVAGQRRAYLGGGFHEPNTTVKYFHRLTDMLNIGRGRVRMPNGSKGRPFPRGVVADRFVEPCHLSIESVEFMMELIIVRKAAGVGRSEEGVRLAEVGVRPTPRAASRRGKCRPRMTKSQRRGRRRNRRRSQDQST